MTPVFSPPTDEDFTRLASQWQSVVQLVKEDYGVPFDQSEPSLGLLQRILDDDLVGDNEYGLQCLGVAFGRIMAYNIPGLDWWIVEDEYGRDPCLRYKETTYQLNPITMISGRVLRGETVTVTDLYEAMKALVNKQGPSMS